MRSSNLHVEQTARRCQSYRPGTALQNYRLGGACCLVTRRCSRALPPRFRPSFFQLLEGGWLLTHSKVPPVNCPWPKQAAQPRFHAPSPSTGSPHPVTGPHGSLRYLASVENIFKNYFIYFWLCWVLVAALTFSSCSEPGLLFLWVCRLLTVDTSLVAEHQL